METMSLIGKKVSHATFGEGIITEVNESIVNVDFEKVGTKKFRYPTGFNFLKFIDDEELTQKVLNERETAIEKKKQENSL